MMRVKKESVVLLEWKLGVSELEAGVSKKGTAVSGERADVLFMYRPVGSFDLGDSLAAAMMTGGAEEAASASKIIEVKVRELTGNFCNPR
jgi:hypothetical protein